MTVSKRHLKIEVGRGSQKYICIDFRLVNRKPSVLMHAGFFGWKGLPNVCGSVFRGWGQNLTTGRSP